jgi:hypothetical protein
MPPDSSLSCLIAALCLGAFCEMIARFFKLWRYRRPVFALVNILIVFGLIQGLAVARLIGGGQNLLAITPVLFMGGAIAGLLVEGLNERRLKAWDWPQGALCGVRRPIDKAALIGVAWGFVPVFTLLVARLAAGSGSS